jgi:3-deoxy-D-manno-octulosonate 8-phosphate phosphatase (KDO 8-P phosphatase)
VKRVPSKLRNRAKKIKLLLLDVDGVLTDGGIFIDAHGSETKRFHVRDGQGITLLKRAGIEVGFISGRSSNVVRHRARELGVKIVYQGVQNKVETYNRIKQKTGLKDGEIAYVGDDIVDLPILRRVGFAVAVRDCWSGIATAVDYMTRAKGGHGAVREVSELLLEAKKLIRP